MLTTPCKNLWNHLSIEPAYLLYNVAYGIMEQVNTNLILQKSCRYNTTIEPDLDTVCDDEKRGITYVANVNATYRFIMSLVVNVLVIFASTWSDKAGKKRKIFLILPSFGQIIHCISKCVQSYFWSLSAMIAVWSELICQTLSGGCTFVRLFAIVYMCDISTKENRTMNISILNALYLLSLPISYASSGYLMYHLGFLGTYSVCLVISVLGCIFGILCIKDSSTSCEVKIPIWRMFSIKDIVNAFKTVFRKKTGRKTTVIAILAITNLLACFSYFGERSVSYLYFRYRFQWNERMYGVYLGYKSIGVIFGTLFCSIVLSKLFKIHDGIIGAFAGFWDTVTVFFYLFATETWQLYLIPIFDIFHGIALSICDSFQSKFFQSNEYGQLFSVHTCILLLLPLGGLVYSELFKITMDVFPASFFLFSLFINILVFILYWTAYIFTKGEISQDI